MMFSMFEMYASYPYIESFAQQNTFPSPPILCVFLTYPTTFRHLDGRVKEVIVDSRINKILAMRTDSVAMLEALDAISEFYGANTVDARRSLRQDLELQNIQLAKRFLSEFDQVHKNIQEVENQANGMVEACQSLASRVSDADSNMKSFMEKASELENRRNMYNLQSEEIRTFLGRFQLSSKEVDILSKSNIDDPREAKHFFDALKRLKTAYSECKQMVEKQNYTAGFELLDILGQHQDTAYERLFDWVKNKCENLPESGSSEDVDSLLQISIRYLKSLPLYFAQCQDLVVTSRRTQLVQRFVIALTQGGPSGQVFRAMDVHAHDALRYVGDMLAWMHQAVASEEEFLESVFGDGHDEGKVRNLADDANTEHETEGNDDENAEAGFTIQDLLARCLQGLGRPLRVRIMQSLETRAGIEVLYALTDLLSFYEKTFSSIVKKENAVHSTIKGCLMECRRLFASSLNKQADALLATPASYPTDLTASHATKECCRQIHEILRVHGTALSNISYDNSDECHIDTVLGSIIQPLLQSCRMGGQNSGVSSGDTAIFMLNNVSAVQNVLKDAAKISESGQLATSTWLEHLDVESKTWVDVLVREEVSRTLHRSDLDKLMESIDVLPVELVASNQPGLDQDRIGTVLRAFYSSLFSTVAPHFERLKDPEFREITRKETAEAVATCYEKLYTIVSNPKNQYNTSIISHSPSEVRVLLGCT